MDQVTYERRSYIVKLIIAVCSTLTFLTLLTVTIVVVPKAVNLMNTAQRTLDNIETVSEELKALELADAVKNIEENTAQAMTDVSEAMKKINDLDMASLNDSIRDLKESTEQFSNLLRQ